MNLQVFHRTILTGLASFFIISPALLWAEPETKKQPPEDEVIRLFPGTITYDENTTYQADVTLAGSRIRAELKDVSSAITVVTKESLAPSVAADASKPRMEVVFALDTTGSMSAMIEGAKQKIWAIANKLKSAQPSPEIRFGLGRVFKPCE